MSSSQSAQPQLTSTESEQTTPSDNVTINVKAPGDSKLSLSISLSKTVLDLKKLIAESTNPRVEAENQRLIYSGRVLKDESILTEYKIQSGHSVHMVKGVARPSNPTPATQQIPANLNAGQQIAGNPLAPLLNATNQIPAFNPFADLGINTNDPNMAMNLMNNPQVLREAARALEDPAMVEQMITGDPRLRAIGPELRDLLRSPLFRQMLTNPNLIRGMVEGGVPGAGNTAAAPAAGVTDSLAAALGAQPAGTGANPASAPGAIDPMALLNSPFGQMTMQATGRGMFGGLGNPLAAQPPADPRPPEERFEVQLAQLQGMGFVDARQNVRALLASGGDVAAAIEYILGGNGA